MKQSSFTKLSKDNETHRRGSQWKSKKRTRIDFADSVSPGRENNSIYSIHPQEPDEYVVMTQLVMMNLI